MSDRADDRATPSDAEQEHHDAAWPEHDAPATADLPDAGPAPSGELATQDPDTVASAPRSDGSDGSDGGGDLAERLRDVERERDTYLDHLRRERAEFDNYRRRSTREQSEAFDRGAERLTSQLLGVLDNFGYVLEAAKDHDDAVAKGVRMVHEELRDVLGRAGLEEVPGVGAPFDPTWHDAVMQVEGDGGHDADEPVVAQVLRTGYRFKGRVLRPASVAVTQP